jgi:hypothetical protein
MTELNEPDADLDNHAVVVEIATHSGVLDDPALNRLSAVLSELATAVAEAAAGGRSIDLADIADPGDIEDTLATLTLEVVRSRNPESWRAALMEMAVLAVGAVLSADCAAAGGVLHALAAAAAAARAPAPLSTLDHVLIMVAGQHEGEVLTDIEAARRRIAPTARLDLMGFTAPDYDDIQDAILKRWGLDLVIQSAATPNDIAAAIDVGAGLVNKAKGVATHG